MELIDGIHKKPGMHRSLLDYHPSEGDNVFGWTYEQLGWPMKAGGIVVSEKCIASPGLEVEPARGGGHHS